MNSERRSIFAFPAGRRSKWVVLLVWLAAMFVAFGANLPGKFTDAEDNESTSFLPGDAESTKALAKAEALQGGELAPAVIVYRRAGGLTDADRRKIVEDVRRLTERRFPAPVAPGSTGAAGGRSCPPTSWATASPNRCSTRSSSGATACPIRAAASR